MARKRRRNPVLRHHGYGTACAFPSLKNGKGDVFCDSLLEGNFCYILEFNPWVLHYEAQPSPVEALLEDGTTHTYHPDFLVTGETGKLMVEIKPEVEVNTPHTEQQLAVGRTWAKNNDCGFLLVTDAHLYGTPLLRNLQVLYHPAWLDIPWSVREQVREILADHSQGLSFGVLVAELEAIQARDIWLPARNIVRCLLFHHALVADLSTLLTDQTVIWLADHHHEEREGDHGEESVLDWHVL